MDQRAGPDKGIDIILPQSVMDIGPDPSEADSLPVLQAVGSWENEIAAGIRLPAGELSVIHNLLILTLREIIRT